MDWEKPKVINIAEDVDKDGAGACNDGSGDVEWCTMGTNAGDGGCGQGLSPGAGGCFSGTLGYITSELGKNKKLSDIVKEK